MTEQANFHSLPHSCHSKNSSNVFPSSIRATSPGSTITSTPPFPTALSNRDIQGHGAFMWAILVALITKALRFKSSLPITHLTLKMLGCPH